MASIYSSVGFFLITYICTTYSIPCTAVKRWERNLELLPPGSSAIEGKFQKREQKALESSNSRRSDRSSSTVKFGAKETKRFAVECLAAHNQYRRKHKVKPLQLSEKLNKRSQKWADETARTNIFQHSNYLPYGENIYMAGKIRKLNTLFVNGSEPVHIWYQTEVKFFKYGKKNANYLKTGHFTQVIWAGTKFLGVGVAKSYDNNLYVVCQYDPPGNYEGMYDVNVFPVGGLQRWKRKTKDKGE